MQLGGANSGIQVLHGSELVQQAPSVLFLSSVLHFSKQQRYSI